MTFKISEATRFPRRTGDLTWGKYAYNVTHTQKQALDGLLYVVYGVAPEHIDRGLPNDAYYSQNPLNGDVILGINSRSVTVKRSGRLYSNQNGKAIG